MHGHCRHNGRQLEKEDREILFQSRIVKIKVDGFLKQIKFILNMDSAKSNLQDVVESLQIYYTED